LTSALGKGLNITETELKTRMDFLLGKGLLFEEGARFMSLVLPVRTQRPTGGSVARYADRTAGTRDRKLDRVAAAAS
jgi:hypothetical protein